eukprot:2227799-Pleurochrysis_carterae.AAC.1
MPRRQSDATMPKPMPSSPGVPPKIAELNDNADVAEAQSRIDARIARARADGYAQYIPSDLSIGTLAELESIATADAYSRYSYEGVPRFKPQPHQPQRPIAGWPLLSLMCNVILLTVAIVLGTQHILFDPGATCAPSRFIIRTLTFSLALLHYAVFLVPVAMTCAVASMLLLRAKKGISTSLGKPC